ncbi:MAG: TetR/AcrR family transcriptional regulator [Pseudomonadota bacterium]
MAGLSAVILTGRDSSTAVKSPKRDAIVEAATRLFLDSGYDAVSMDAIAEAAKVSKRTVYSHFSNKQTLFGAVMQMMCQRFNRMDPEGDVPTGLPEEVLMEVGIDFVTLITSPEAIALYRTVTAEAPRHPELAEVFYQNGPDPFCSALSRYFEDQTAKGVLAMEDSVRAAQQFWELVKSPFHMKLLLGLAERPGEAAIHASVETTVGDFLKIYRAAA